MKKKIKYKKNEKKSTIRKETSGKKANSGSFD